MELKQLSEEIRRDSGIQVEDCFLFPSSPMWKRHSVKRKTGGDRTQRQNEGQASYPPPDLKEKVNNIQGDEKNKYDLLYRRRMEEERKQRYKSPKMRSDGEA